MSNAPNVPAPDPVTPSRWPSTTALLRELDPKPTLPLPRHVRATLKGREPVVSAIAGEG